MLFEDGELLDREFSTSKGVVGVIAEIKVEGKTLHLYDLAIYPKGAKKFIVGLRESLRVYRQLTQEAKAEGFETLHIVAKRYSGANPGKAIDRLIDLTKK